MSPVNSKSTKNDSAHSGKQKDKVQLPFDSFIQSDFLLSPYRTLSRAFLHTHHNTAAFVQINRKLVDDLREIIRRQQDVALKLSENMFQQMSEGATPSKSGFEQRGESLGQYFKSAMNGAHECAQAIGEAQVHAFEAFQEQARESARPNGKQDHLAQAAE